MQSRENIWGDENLIKTLRENGVAIIPTDTIYGMVGKAENESVVNRIYSIRKRNPQKPCIILIGDMAELQKFSINISEEQKKELEKYWPGPVSVVLDCLDDSFSYLHRDTRTLAFRLPVSEVFRKFLLKVGPLIAPSANLETYPPNDNIADAKKYFGDSVDLYMDGGIIFGKASKVLRLHPDGRGEVLRA